MARSTPLHERGLLIGGRLVEGASRLAVVDPSTEEVFAQAHRASTEQFEMAISAAKGALAAAAARSLDERRLLLARMADAVEGALDELTELTVLEVGMPIAMARREIQGLCNFLRETCRFDLAPRLIGSQPGRRLEEHRRPLGVVAAIVPWNHPALLIGSKLAPALLAGNAVIIKPAPTTPLSALALGALFVDIVPSGLINVVVDANDLGPRLTAHPDVAKVSFTGSTLTGMRIMENGAATLKHLTLELGGNDAAIVFDDVDIEAVASTLFDAAFRNTGQGCTATKRIYAHRRIYEALGDAMERHAAVAKVGRGSDPDVQFGPLQNRRQFERVRALIEDARARGARVFGGETLSPGYFIRPAIVRDIAEGAPLVDEEQFGPAIPLISFEDENEVIARINASPYGLAGSVWSRDEERGYRVACQLVTGSVAVNRPLYPGIDIPFAGAKWSGLGVENALEGLHAFTQLQIIDRNANVKHAKARIEHSAVSDGLQ